MAYHGMNRMGAFIQNPNETQMGALLDSLGKRDPEHPDVALKHETGWCISVNGSGTVVFENVETGEGPWHLLRQSREKVMVLWLLLAQGNLDALKKHSWSPGYAP